MRAFSMVFLSSHVGLGTVQDAEGLLTDSMPKEKSPMCLLASASVSEIYHRRRNDEVAN
jgi:hypothetical protein